LTNNFYKINLGRFLKNKYDYDDKKLFLLHCNCPELKNLNKKGIFLFVRGGFLRIIWTYNSQRIKALRQAKGFVVGDQKICLACLLNYKIYHAIFLEHITSARTLQDKNFTLRFRDPRTRLL
jgi:hypothetical protein